MSKLIIGLLNASILIMFTSIHSHAQTLAELEKRRVNLPNGWSLTAAGSSLRLGDLPLNIAVSPSKKWLAVTNNGQSEQSIELIDAARHVILDTAVIGKSWLGLTFSGDEKYLYAAGGNDNWIIRYNIINQKLSPKDTITLGKPWPEKISPAGMALDDNTSRLYVVTKESGELYVIDINTKKAIQKLALGAEAYTCLLSPDKKMLFITCWGCDKVIIYNTVKNRIESSIAVGDNPNDMCLSKNGLYLFVANANDNSVSVMDVKKRKVVETLNAALYPDAPSGSTTNSVCISEDDKTLYIANADNNCLAVFDVSKPGYSKSKGFIPTGWYPTCVRIIGSTIFVTNGKGFSSMANPQGPNPAKKRQKVNYQQGESKKADRVQYIAGLFKGTLSIINTPNDMQLSIYSQAVYQNTPYTKAKEENTQSKVGNPIPGHVGDISPIKYVFYIIKENRTYDQVLSDIPTGNGDSTLLLFGNRVTPNQHAISKEFVLLDNFYVDAEVSADGHNWSTGAYATDYLEKTWPTSYGGRGGGYDAEGNRAIANNKNGFIWDLCKKYGVSYRTYGEFADGYKPNIPALKDHLCPYYTSWDPDVKDTTRYSQWRRDFDSLITINNVPKFNTLRFINDHTMGLRPGKLSPFAQVADNDLATGLFVDHLSHSSIWNESVVFVLEDDAQNGPDHIDAHRSTVYIAGGLVKKGFVDHTMYSTSSVLRTMELILGLPPMTQYDAAAMPMWRCFNDSSTHIPFTVKPAQVDLTEVNVAMNKWSEMSEGFDFAAEDRAPDLQLNQVLWVAVKGDKCTFPAPKHAAFIKVSEKSEDDD